jgi:dipeptidyl aminopeptidase/acylaminoacyl peptidase
MRPKALALLVFAGGCAAAGSRPPDLPPRSEPALIPIATFFASRESNYGYRVSFDGRRLAWLASAGGRMTVHVRELGGSEVRVLDTPSSRSLGTFWWAADSRHVLFTQDQSGDQNDHVYLADTEQPAVPPVDLTPIGAARAMVHRILPNDPEHLLAMHNARTRQGFDLVRINLRTREMAVIAENPGDVIQWITDHHGQLRGRVRSLGDTARQVEWRIGDEWRAGPRLDIEELFTVAGFTPDRAEAWVLTNHGRDRVALMRVDPTTGRQTLLHDHPDADVETAVVSIATGDLLYSAAYPGYPQVRFFDRRLEAAFEAIRGGEQAGFTLLSRDLGGRMATLEAYSHRGSTYWLVDWETGRRTLLGRSAIAGHAHALAPVEPVALRSRDGLTLHSYLTRPPGGGARPAPMILLVHGGPWFRDYWGYSPTVQFLANRGYAVLQVNYRGSTGYGRRFREAAVGEFAGKMHDDLLDAVDWAVARGVADRRRVAIMGWSYGGYATLVGLTFTPEVFACGVDIVGVSNLVSQLETRHTYWTWHMLRPFWHKYAGDPARPEDRRRLEAKSPLFRADRVQRPLLIAHGANDPNVKQLESDQMVEALRRAGKSVEYLLFKDEGHGGFDWRSNLKLFAAIESFLARHLGGRRG